MANITNRTPLMKNKKGNLTTKTKGYKPTSELCLPKHKQEKNTPKENKMAALPYKAKKKTTTRHNQRT